jgi:cell wall-active antibiotic response 4TMS protein YvqF
MGGSLVGGGVLIAAGFALLLHTRFGVSLDWVEEWWPIFPMLFGAYLVGKAVSDKAKRVG